MHCRETVLSSAIVYKHLKLEVETSFFPKSILKKTVINLNPLAFLVFVHLAA